MQLKNVVLLMLLICSLPAAADGNLISPMAVIGQIVVIVISGLAIAFLLSYIFRNLVQKTRKEKRTHLWFMTMLTFIFPAIYLIAEDEWHLLGILESEFGYVVRETFNSIVFVSMVFLGFNAGYFITSRKESLQATSGDKIETNTSRRKLVLAWLLVLVCLFGLRMRPVLKTRETLSYYEKEKDEMTQNANTYMSKVLNANFKDVIWDKHSRKYSAIAADGRSIQTNYDPRFEYYYMSVTVSKQIELKDTITWLVNLPLIKPFLDSTNSEYFQKFTQDLNNKNFAIAPDGENGYNFQMPFEHRELHMLYKPLKKQIEIIWSTPLDLKSLVRPFPPAKK